MAIYRVQRLYSDENQDKGSSGMGTLGKVALGAAAIGGGLMAGKAGMLGTSVQRGIGTSTAWLGNKVGSQAMINSGAKTVGKATATDVAKGYGIELSREGVKTAKETMGNDKALAAFKDIGKQRSSASQGILDKYKLAAQEVAFSEDTDADLREAAIIGGLGAGTIGVGLMAKHGLLGKTGKKTYRAVSEKVKTIWNEAKKPNPEKEEVVSKTVEKGGKSGTTATTEKITKESGKPDKINIETTARKVKFSPEDWPKVLKVIKEKGMDPSNPAHKLVAAKIAGIKPISVK